MADYLVNPGDLAEPRSTASTAPRPFVELLDTLPREVLARIFSYTDLQTASSLAAACPAARALAVERMNPRCLLQEWFRQADLPKVLETMDRTDTVVIGDVAQEYYEGKRIDEARRIDLLVLSHDVLDVQEALEVAGVRWNDVGCRIAGLFSCEGGKATFTEKELGGFRDLAWRRFLDGLEASLPGYPPTPLYLYVKSRIRYEGHVGSFYPSINLNADQLLARYYCHSLPDKEKSRRFDSVRAAVRAGRPRGYRRCQSDLAYQVEGTLKGTRTKVTARRLDDYLSQGRLTSKDSTDEMTYYRVFGTLGAREISLFFPDLSYWSPKNVPAMMNECENVSEYVLATWGAVQSGFRPNPRHRICNLALFDADYWARWWPKDMTTPEELGRFKPIVHDIFIRRDQGIHDLMDMYWVNNNQAGPYSEVSSLSESVRRKLARQLVVARFAPFDGVYEVEEKNGARTLGLDP